MVSLYCPDILVLTGHDSLLKNCHRQDLRGYRSSRYFTEAIRTARQAACGRGNLVVFAGACQSFYEALITAGANFAASPARTFIHLYDPVLIAGNIAYTLFSQFIPLKETIRMTISGEKGIGGVETTGCARLGFPFLIFQETPNFE